MKHFHTFTYYSTLATALCERLLLDFFFLRLYIFFAAVSSMQLVVRVAGIVAVCSSIAMLLPYL